MSVLFIHSHFGLPPAGYANDERIVVLRERELNAGHFAVASGVITTTHLDQIGWLDHLPALVELLNRGGNWFFNGHFMRPFLPEIAPYVRLENPRRADLALTRLVEHPIFAGTDQKSLEENRGVAGFYGRGHNPMPPGGVAINGIGPDLRPVDWVWDRPKGGRIFSHAGNDLGGVEQGAPLVPRIIAWANGEI